MSDTKEAINRLRQMRYDLEAADVSGISDMLFNDAEFETLCIQIAEEAIERELQAQAIKEREKELADRRNRLLSSAQTLRDIVLQCLDSKGLKTLTSPYLTLSVGNVKPTVVVTDESLLPSRFFVQPAPTLDKKALNDAVLNDGEIIEGTSISNGKINLTIRRK